MESLLLFLPGFLAVYGLSYHYLFRSWAPVSSSCAISSAANELALEFSITYFISDMLHLLVFRPSDILFIAHLAATLFAFLACRYLILHEVYELLVLLIIAYITSARQNTWTLVCIRNMNKLKITFATHMLHTLALIIMIRSRG